MSSSPRRRAPAPRPRRDRLCSACPVAGSIAMTAVHRCDLLGRRERPAPTRRLRDDDDARAAIAEDVAVVVDGVGDIGRDGDRAGAHDREIGDHPFRPVFGDEHDPVAAARYPSERARAPAGSRPRRLRPAQRLVLAVPLGPQKRLVAAAPLRRRTSPAGCGNCRNPWLPVLRLHFFTVFNQLAEDLVAEMFSTAQERKIIRRL